MYFLEEILFEGFGLWGLIFIIVLFVKISNLKKRVGILEHKLNNIRVSAALIKSDSFRTQTDEERPDVSASQIDNLAQDRKLAEELYQASRHEKSDKESSFEAFIKWLKDDWLLKTGAFLLLIGFGWLVTYAFMNNWIGEGGRITLGIFAGAAILALGSWRIKKFKNQGVVFTALGSTVILLTVWAAREMYEFFNPFIALSIMFLSTVFVAFVSVKYRAMSLAVIGLVLAAIAPNLTASVGANYVSLFSYLSVVVVGIIWVVLLTGWRVLTVLALSVVFLYSLFVMDGTGLTTRSTILLFAYGFGSLFYLVNTAGLLRLKDKSTRSDIITAALNGLFLLLWIRNAAPEEWQSLIISAWMLVFGSGAFIIFKYTRRKFAFYIYAGIGIAMLAAATAAQLDGAALTIAYIIESAIISLVIYSALNDHIMGQKFSLLMIGPVIMAVEDISRFDRAGTVLNKYFFTILVLAISLFVLGLAYRYFSRGMEKKGLFGNLYIVQIILASLYVYILLWHSLQNGLDVKSVAVMTAMIIYTIIGLFTHIYGKSINSKVFYFYGSTMLALVVLRLLMVDVWQMDLTRRIITFFLVGALLISTAFINKKKINNLTN